MCHAILLFPELILLENAYHNNQEYRFEDFFWTGSGDGTSDIDDETYWTSEKPETVYKTKTIISTVYVATPSTYDNQVSIETMKNK